MNTPYAPPPPKEVNHLLHLILTILTGGLWVLVWGYLAVVHAGEKKMWENTYLTPPASTEPLPRFFDDDGNMWTLVPHGTVLPYDSVAAHVVDEDTFGFFRVDQPDGEMVDYYYDPTPVYVRHLTASGRV